MPRRNPRVRIDNQGRLEVVDPSYDFLDLLQEVDPGFRVVTADLPGFKWPAFQAMRTARYSVESSALSSLSEPKLWRMHRDRTQICANATASAASVLDVKIELARRLLFQCTLCARRCGVNRHAGELGACRLGTEALVAEHFVHIAEEPPINPSLVLNLAGCALRCRYCQQGAILSPSSVVGEELSSDLWRCLDVGSARSLSFVGGNPDESLYAVLRFLAAAPLDWSLPIVWNSHAYSSVEALELLDGIADAFVPDLKYGCDGCGETLAGVPDYFHVARRSIPSMLAHKAWVIVRILVLPGHIECCHIPALEYLAGVKRSNLLVSIRGQYCPDWKISHKDGVLQRRCLEEEVRSVAERATRLGLPCVDANQIDDRNSQLLIPATSISLSVIR
jgi:putative pyruvate formate lyase activating enzyme